VTLMFGALHIGVWTIDRDGVTTSANPRLLALLGTTEDRMIGRPLVEFIHPDDHQTVLRAMRQRRDGLSNTYDLRLLRAADTVVHARVHASPIIRDGTFVGTVAAIADISDLVQHIADQDEALRDAEEAIVNKTRFLSWVSHELRTPLNTISGFAQLLQASVADQSERDMAGSILSASSHVNSLVQDLLDYSKADANMLEPALTAVRLRSVLDDAVALVDGTARELDVHIDLAAGDEWVSADRRHLVQVMVNLLSNAVKYGGRGTTVRVRTSTIDAVVRCAISDEGPGIPADLQRRAFRPFERLDNASGVAGVGLGLSIADSFVRAMKGTLTLSSPPGSGATFIVELPAAVDVSDRADVTPVPPSNRMVLYVEDEPLNASLLDSIISLLPGRELQVEPTVAGGITAARELHPTLILLDLHLPDGSGFDVLHAVREDPKTAETPVFVLSADATEEAGRHALELGADRYITKPFNLKEFLALLDATT
jgi:PAS domain S-box-containing protein